jgi:hypothetical protein
MNLARVLPGVHAPVGGGPHVADRIGLRRGYPEQRPRRRDRRRRGRAIQESHRQPAGQRTPARGAQNTALGIRGTHHPPLLATGIRQANCWRRKLGRAGIHRARRVPAGCACRARRELRDPHLRPVARSGYPRDTSSRLLRHATRARPRGPPGCPLGPQTGRTRLLACQRSAAHAGECC